MNKENINRFDLIELINKELDNLNYGELKDILNLLKNE